MLISHCPNCQHDNKPGDRYCGSCGEMLDLRTCPTCGKVDGVKATVCTACGTRLPPEPVEPIAAADEDPETAAPAQASPPTSVIRPLPLIVIAVAAGGIPLLWLYRQNIPVPKVWQPQMQSASQIAPATPPPIPLVAAESAPAPTKPGAKQKPVAECTEAVAALGLCNSKPARK